MSQVSYYIDVYDLNAVFVSRYDNFSSIEFGRQKNDVGACNVKIPGNLVDLSHFGEDTMIEIWRFNNMSGQFELVGETVWILQKLEYYVENDYLLDMIFFDTISVLRRRYNLWQLHSIPDVLPEIPAFDYPSHLYRHVSDSIMQLFNHNFGRNTATPDPDMELEPPAAVVTAVGGIGASNRTLEIIYASPLPEELISPIVPFECAWKEVLSAMQELANISENANIPLWFDIVYKPATNIGFGSFTFRIWEKQRGNIRRDMAFGTEYGNLESPRYVLDFTEKKDVVVATADEILDVVPVVDEKVMGLALRSTYRNGIFRGKEIVIEQTKTSDIENDFIDNALASQAQAELNARKAIRKLTGDIINLPGQQFFIDYKYGDIVIVSFMNVEFFAEINKFSVVFDGSGEKITIPIESTQLVV